MRALVLVLGVAACIRAPSHQCASDTECVRGGSTGVCEPVGACSFDDASCPSGRRFGELSGPHAGQCTESFTPPDADIDGEIDAPRDLDNDGLIDVDDNCPALANPGQANEDGDRFGDVCDPCPPIAADNPPDGDGDGVADACDPRPAIGGDTMAVFEGFAAGIPASWVRNGTWSAAAGAASADAPAARAWLATPPLSTSRSTVTTSLTVLGVTGMVNVAGVMDKATTPAGDPSVRCAIYIATGFTPSPGLSVFDGHTSTTLGVVGYEMTTGLTYTVTQRREATSYTCTSQRGASTASVGPVTTASGAVPYATGVSHFGANIRYHWLMVVTSP